LSTKGASDVMAALDKALMTSALDHVAGAHRSRLSLAQHRST
jgi:hypothetical protein